METTPPLESSRFSDNTSCDLAEERFASEPSPTESPAGSHLLGNIRETAREFGVSLRTLRFYEDRGLIHPRRIGSARYFTPRDKLHLKMILKGKELGFTLSEIRDILDVRDDDAPFAESPVSAVGGETAGHAAKAFGHVAELDPAHLDLAKIDLAMGLRPEQIVAQIEHLERQRRQLDEAISALREAQRRRCPA